MLMEFLAGVAFVAFAGCVVYTFWMVAQETEDQEGNEPWR